MCIKTARLGTYLDVSSLETLSSEYGKMNDVKVVQKLSLVKFFVTNFT